MHIHSLQSGNDKIKFWYILQHKPIIERMIQLRFCLDVNAKLCFLSLCSCETRTSNFAVIKAVSAISAFASATALHQR